MSEDQQSFLYTRLTLKIRLVPQVDFCVSQGPALSKRFTMNSHQSHPTRINLWLLQPTHQVQRHMHRCAEVRRQWTKPMVELSPGYKFKETSQRQGISAQWSYLRTSMTRMMTRCQEKLQGKTLATHLPSLHLPTPLRRVQRIHRKTPLSNNRSLSKTTAGSRPQRASQNLVWMVNLRWKCLKDRHS